MLIVLFFVCQRSSSIAEMNIQTNTVILSTDPSDELNDQEIISCIAQDKQSSVYTVIIGDNVFRSSLVIYNAFQKAQITLNPVDGSSVEKSFSFFIASYEIEFLENTLIQKGAIGQLLSTIYNYNQCILDSSLLYETYIFILPILNINPKCSIVPTSDVEYIYSMQEQIVMKQIIKKEKFDFAVFSLSKLNCSIGTEDQKQMCVKLSQSISFEKFISFQVDIKIPKTITSQNIYIDDYGQSNNVTSTYNFELVYKLVISRRLALDNCTKDDQLSFEKDSIRVFSKIDLPCDFSPYPIRTFWVTASEFSDNTGKIFELQFYVPQLFDLNQYVDCSTWEISKYESIEQCLQKLVDVQNFPLNFTSSIAYTLYDSTNVYKGSYRADCRNLQGGEAIVTILENTICVQIFDNYTTDRPFTNIYIKISTSYTRFQQNIIDFSVSNNIIFPSVDNIYCFNIDDQQQLSLRDVSFQETFGTVELLENHLRIKEIQPLLPYPVFYEGYIFLVVYILITITWVVVKQKVKRKSERKSNIRNQN